MAHPVGVNLGVRVKVVSRLLPQKVRNELRTSYDSLYSKRLASKETIGALSQWTIVTSVLQPGAVIYSGGVGEDITFELELIRRFGAMIYIFDPSPVAVRTIELANNPNLLFRPIGLSDTTQGTFSYGGGAGANTWLKAGAGETYECTTIPIALAANHHDSIDLLKIDIEGFEYPVLEECVRANIPIKQLCVEFHDFFPDIPRVKTQGMIRTLKAHGFELIHRHRHDYTFLRRDLVGSNG